MSREQTNGCFTDIEKELCRDIWEGLGIQDYADECIWKKARVENCALALARKGYRKQNVGEWYKIDGFPRHHFCKMCGKGYRTRHNFCPNCGAHMIGG